VSERVKESAFCIMDVYSKFLLYQVYIMIKLSVQDEHFFSEASQYFEHILLERDILIDEIKSMPNLLRIPRLRKIIDFDTSLEKTFQDCESYQNNDCDKPPFSIWIPYFDDFHITIDDELKNCNELSDSFLLNLYNKRLHLKKSGEHQEFENQNNNLYAIADEMRIRKEEDEFNSYRDAYRHAEKTILSFGKKFTWKSLEKAYSKAKKRGKV